MTIKEEVESCPPGDINIAGICISAKECRKTELGNRITRGFFPSPDGENYNLLTKLFGAGYKELYYTAPYHWGVMNPETKEIVAYTEGDVDLIQCDTDKFIEEAKKHIEFMKEQYPDSPVVWTEGKEYIEKLERK